MYQIVNFIEFSNFLNYQIRKLTAYQVYQI